jgi:hypothetical protein
MIVTVRLTASALRATASLAEALRAKAEAGHYKTSGPVKPATTTLL